MDLAQFILVTSLLLSSPYITPTVVGLKVWTIKDASDHMQNLKSFWYWVAEIAVLLSMVGAIFYLVEMAPHNGLVDINMFAKDPSDILIKAWDVVRYALCFDGLALGSFLFYKGTKVKTGKKDLSKFLQTFGCLCILYGISIPFLMNHFVGVIRDSHLMN